MRNSKEIAALKELVGKLSTRLECLELDLFLKEHPQRFKFGDKVKYTIFMDFGGKSVTRGLTVVGYKRIPVKTYDRYGYEVFVKFPNETIESIAESNLSLEV